MPGKSHEQSSLLGYSPWGHKRIRYDLAAKQQLQLYCVLINFQSSCQTDDTLSHLINNIWEYWNCSIFLTDLVIISLIHCSHFNDYGFNWNLFYVGHFFSLTHWLITLLSLMQRYSDFNFFYINFDKIYFKNVYFIGSVKIVMNLFIIFIIF